VEAVLAVTPERALIPVNGGLWPGDWRRTRASAVRFESLTGILTTPDF
jgi:hypothetical protein